MTKITQEKFLEMVKKDKAMAKRLSDYLSSTTDEREAAKKTIEFAKKEGYEIDTKQSLETDDLENVSGGSLAGSLSGFFNKIGGFLHKVDNESTASNVVSGSHEEKEIGGNSGGEPPFHANNENINNNINNNIK